MKPIDRIKALERRVIASNWKPHVIYMNEKDNEEEKIDAYFSSIGKPKVDAKNIIIVRFISPKDTANITANEAANSAREFKIPVFNYSNTGT